MIIAPLLVSVAAMQSAAPAVVHRPRGYATAAVWFSHHPPDQFHYRSFITSVGGSAWDLSGGAGFALTPSLGLEGGLVYGGRVSTPQSTFYTEQVRDVVLNALVRYRPSSLSRLALVAGGGYAWTHTSENPPQLTPQPAWWHGWTFTGGADIVAAESVHAAIAPSFRVRWVNRADALDGWNGLSGMSFQIGVSVLLR